MNTCELGVHKLNQKLGNKNTETLSPVSIISASESKTLTTNSTKIAMLVQLAPLTECLRESVTAGGMERCKFEMTKVEFYSILLTHETTSSWKLEGYQRHSLSDDERAQIVDEYNIGKFYGSKLAIGIFDEPDLPFESDSHENTSRPPMAVVAASISGLFCLGLVLHHRKRLQNGYAPIHLTKGDHVQGKKPTKETPEERSLRPADAAGSCTEGQTFKQEVNERFAV
ncbi:hypothetical protein BBJ29_000010 [Phytophthora kernoviae]|uniref:Uncharacterized protein n=1 Tax=Phytophthora kernoviae TaxID=325452 RepID=A0A3F2S2B7_9STRA|nr:hypothetical protein BBJ29_000010 [Phytophthora kernoviae]RLN68991.1 hypothetical protein BBP00_00000629 [Phytophthora kernoviae]